MYIVQVTRESICAIDSKLKRSMDIVAKTSTMYEKGLPDPSITPVTTILRCISEVIPLSKSIIHKLESRSVADIGKQLLSYSYLLRIRVDNVNNYMLFLCINLGIQMGRRFKPSWGRGLTLLTLSTKKQADDVLLNNSFEQIGSYVCGRSPEDTTSVGIVQRIQILGGSGTGEERIKTFKVNFIFKHLHYLELDIVIFILLFSFFVTSFKESIEGHLKIQLSHRVMNPDEDCLIFDVDTDINKASMALHAHCSLAEEFAEQFATDSFASYVANVWKLCVALWGNLPDINVATGMYNMYVNL